MSLISLGAFPPGVESGRLGFSRAVDMQNRAAQEVAEAGIRGLNEDWVSLSEEALAHREGRKASVPSMTDGLIDSQVAQYMALANAKVVQKSAETAASAMDLLGG